MSLHLFNAYMINSRKIKHLAMHPQLALLNFIFQVLHPNYKLAFQLQPYNDRMWFFFYEINSGNFLKIQ